MESFPAKADFCRLAGEYTLVPVYTVLDTDLETPVSLYYKLAGEEAGFLLESAESNKSFGRYSFIGVRPFARLTARANQTVVTLENGTATLEEPPLAALKAFMGRFTCPALPVMPPFAGGGVGYFSYDAVATWERVRGKPLPEDLLLAELLFCQTIVVMDHLTHSTTLIELVPAEPGADPARRYEAAVGRLADIAGKIRQPLSPIQAPAGCGAGPAGLAAAADEAEYVRMVAKAKEYIDAGDIFQVVLSRRFETNLSDGTSPFSLYRRLRRVNPSPYMFFLNFGERQLIGASPEMLVKIDGGRVFTCPIAGTRPRGKDKAADERLAAELLADQKERAEHAMLVDLGRNDLGRISLPGTVEVTRYMEVEAFSHVMHLVSEVAGKMVPGLGAVDALAACFPAGTVSGAPKVRAMEIIQELEGGSRGSYAGAVGYLDFRGNMDTCITIRTIAVEDGRLAVQAGAGIVADSVPAKEYREVIDKAAALFAVLEGV